MKLLGESTQNKFSLSIKSKMLICFGLMFTIMLIIVELVNIFGIPFTNFGGEQKQHQSEIFRNLNLVADLKKERLLRWMKERRDDTKVICESNIIKSLVAGLCFVKSENVKRDMEGTERWTKQQKE